MGLYTDNGKEHGNYLNGLYRPFLGNVGSSLWQLLLRHPPSSTPLTYLRSSLSQTPSNLLVREDYPGLLKLHSFFLKITSRIKHHTKVQQGPLCPTLMPLASPILTVAHTGISKDRESPFFDRPNFGNAPKKPQIFGGAYMVVSLNSGTRIETAT